MKEGQPSRTAQFIAANVALSTLHPALEGVLPPDAGSETETHTFEPETDETRKSFTAGTQSCIHMNPFSLPFSFSSNVRFKWRKPGFLDDETWFQDTPS